MTTPLTDSCFNFTHESFRADEAEVLARAAAAGVRRMVCLLYTSDAADE